MMEQFIDFRRLKCGRRLTSESVVIRCPKCGQNGIERVLNGSVLTVIHCGQLLGRAGHRFLRGTKFCTVPGELPFYARSISPCFPLPEPTPTGPLPHGRNHTTTG